MKSHSKRGLASILKGKVTMKIKDILDSQPLCLDSLGLITREQAVAMCCIIDAGLLMYKEKRPEFISRYGTFMTEILDKIEQEV